MHAWRQKLYVCFLDQSSVAYWNNLRKASWTDGTSITMPIQATRGYNRTMMGCIGAFMNEPPERMQFRFIRMIAPRTNIETVKDFLLHIRDELPVPPEDAVICVDNHSAHKSAAVKEFARELGLRLEYIPKFSCALNPVEHLWQMIKSRWSKRLACTHRALPIENIEVYLNEVVEEISGRLTHRIMFGSERAYRAVEQGQLV